jgi:dihydrofolate reductase
MFTPASLIAAATSASAPGVFSMSMTKSTAIRARAGREPTSGVRNRDEWGDAATSLELSDRPKEDRDEQGYLFDLYEVMSPWENYAEENPSAPEHELEFAHIWKATPKVVFSRTLDKVEGNATLAEGDVAETVATLKQETDGDLALGGPSLASTFIERGLVDEYRLFIHPVHVGGGTAFFPPLDERIELLLDETRTFGSGAVYLRYSATRPSTTPT